ncbi:MAG: hypothetical protein RL701_3766, partial [Pseudomonadota bacterium]
DVRLRRNPKRGSHERQTVYEILDEAPICHVAFVADGKAMTLPTAHARIGDQLYLHGAAKNRMLLALCEGGTASLTCTLLDGLVLARSAFHHSMNYRAAVVFGRASAVSDEAEKLRALHALIEHVVPGRMRELPPPTAAELKTTLVVRIDIEQASAKIRTGHPVDSEEELELAIWAGVVPLKVVPSAPVPEPRLRADQAPSAAALARAQPSEEVVSQAWNEYEFSTDRRRLQLPWVHAYLRDESYWAKGLAAEAFYAALPSSLCFGAYVDDRQVGFARIVTDGSRFAYLADVFIDETLRGRGVGRAFIAFVMAHPQVKDAHRCLLGTRDAHTFYEPLGFEHAAPGRYMLRYAPDAPR